MAIEMLRIDDRLVHGQIVTAWAKSLHINRIWVIDDEVSKEPFLMNVMHMVAPADTELVITSTEEISTLIDNMEGSQKNTLILVKVPEVAKMVFDAGMKKKELNIGGMGANAERKKLYKNISASKEEIDQLNELKNNGIVVYFQVTPNDKRLLF